MSRKALKQAAAKANKNNVPERAPIPRRVVGTCDHGRPRTSAMRTPLCGSHCASGSRWSLRMR